MASSSSTFSTARLRAAPAVAGQARLVRSAQKDELYLGALRSGAGAVLGALAGAKIWLEWQKEIELLADTAYFMLTTLSGYQTLGEEYVNIIQVDPSGERVPSMFRRIALISLHAIIPYLLDKGLVYLEHELQTDTDATRTLENRALQERRSRTVLWSWLQKRLYWLTQWQRKILWQGVFVLKQSIPLLRRLHLAVFYMNGVFYNFSKRMAGIRYLSYAGSDADNQNIQSSYRILGIISLLHLMLMVSLQVYSFKQRHRARQEWKLHRNLSHHQPQQEKALHRSSRCILCFEERRHATATPCGHLFCWECVTEWCNTKAECPLCREKFQPQKLIYLRYYR